MRPEMFRVASLITLFQRRQIATMQEMKAALGTTVDMTVFRKLRKIAYHSSYSHRGRFYTLEEIARFDERGLWACRDVHFSRFGSLIDTVEQLVVHSDRGMTAAELVEELQVPVKEPLLKLVTENRLAREEILGRFLYCAPKVATRRQQLMQRSMAIPDLPIAMLRVRSKSPSTETKAAIILFFSTLDERQRRLYAGLESLRLGHGGDRQLAQLTGLDVHTIAKGRQELLQQDLQIERTRRAGAGRRSLEKKRPKSSGRSRN